MKIEKYKIPCRLYIFWLNIPVSLPVQQSSKNIRCRIYMPTYTSSQLYSTQYGITFIHIGTLEAFSHTFCYFFLIQAAIIQFSVIIKVRSQHAVPVPVVRQISDRGQKIIRQWSSNHQAVVRQSVKKPMRKC